jgi:hypothetical protein
VLTALLLFVTGCLLAGTFLMMVIVEAWWELNPLQVVVVRTPFALFMLLLILIAGHEATLPHLLFAVPGAPLAAAAFTAYRWWRTGSCSSPGLFRSMVKGANALPGFGARTLDPSLQSPSSDPAPGRASK